MRNRITPGPRRVTGAQLAHALRHGALPTGGFNAEYAASLGDPGSASYSPYGSFVPYPFNASAAAPRGGHRATHAGYLPVAGGGYTPTVYPYGA